MNSPDSFSYVLWFNYVLFSVFSLSFKLWDWLAGGQGWEPHSEDDPVGRGSGELVLRVWEWDCWPLICLVVWAREGCLTTLPLPPVMSKGAAPSTSRMQHSGSWALPFSWAAQYSWPNWLGAGKLPGELGSGRSDLLLINCSKGEN